LQEKELHENSVVKNYFTTAADGKKNDLHLLTGNSSITNEQMEKNVKEIYADFDSQRKKAAAIKADKEDLEELKELENQLQKRKK